MGLVNVLVSLVGVIRWWILVRCMCISGVVYVCVFMDGLEVVL